MLFFDQLKRILMILLDYEEKLKIVDKASRIEMVNMPKKAKEEIINILNGVILWLLII